jgi:hypothetical protein
MMHLFLLFVLVNSEVESSDMYFRSIDTCNYFASAMTRRRVAERPFVVAYCVPRLVDGSKIIPQIY